MTVEFQPEYEPWRHGGWYVTNVRHVTGAVGCVSRRMVNAEGKADRKWRIVCDPRPGDHTYKSRDEAARAEHRITEARRAQCAALPRCGALSDTGLACTKHQGHVVDDGDIRHEHKTSAGYEPCNTCGNTGRWETTTDDSPTTLVDCGPCPDCSIGATRVSNFWYEPREVRA